jgi:hypothetical protein
MSAPGVTSSSTPDEADGKAATQLAARGLVANAARKDMQLGLRSLYLETGAAAVIEHR